MFKKIMLAACLGGGLLTAGCAGTAQTKATATLAIVCDNYAAVLEQLTPLKESGELSVVNIARVDAANRQVTPICSTGSILDPAAAIGTVTAAIDLIKTVGY